MQIDTSGSQKGNKHRASARVRKRLYRNNNAQASKWLFQQYWDHSRLEENFPKRGSIASYMPSQISKIEAQKPALAAASHQLLRMAMHGIHVGHQSFGNNCLLWGKFALFLHLLQLILHSHNSLFGQVGHRKAK